MEAFFPCVTTHCCLCGSSEALTGEHKIKASALRAEFGRNKLVIGRRGEGYRNAQSAGSKELHFKAPLCAECNGSRTQSGDLAFDRFGEIALRFGRRGDDPAMAFQDSRFAEGSRLRLDLYRYFAKLLCCHLAELGAPFQVAISEFAIGYSDENCISLGVNLDSVYARDQLANPGLPYAAHGGLVILADKETLTPSAFYSTLSIGPVCFRYAARFTVAGQMQLEVDAPDFVAWCRDSVRYQRDDPLMQEESMDLGL